MPKFDWMDWQRITWKAVADEIGVNPSTVWRWRTRPGGPTQEQEARITEAVHAILQQRGEGGDHA